MRRPRSSLGNAIVLGTLAAAGLVGCGKGLYTKAAQFRERDGSGGGVVDLGTGSGTGTGTGGSGSGSGSGGTGGAPSPDANVPDNNPSKTPDAKPDVGIGTSKTQEVSSGANALIEYGDATLSIPKDSIPSGRPYHVTLTLVSNGAPLSLPNGDGGTSQVYGGVIGPIYSINFDFVMNETATLSIRFAPDPSISRVGLALVNEASKIWVLAPGSIYDPATNEVSGTVTNPSGVLYFAPVEFCTREGQDGGTCHLGLKCKGEACQE
jgi:hypothetical protein